MATAAGARGPRSGMGNLKIEKNARPCPVRALALSVMAQVVRPLVCAPQLKYSRARRTCLWPPGPAMVRTE